MLGFLPAVYQRVLEIGCGEGAFSKTLSPNSERWGIEPNGAAAADAKDSFYRIMAGTYGQVCKDLPEDYFDLVICNDVIEHMDDHDAFLDSIKTKMCKGGYLVASVPNMRYYKVLKELLLKKDWRYQDQGNMDRTHLRFFTGISLQRTLVEHGFNIRKFTGVNSAFPNFSSIFVLAKSIPLALILLLTLGYYRDILYVQFGFAAQKQD